VWPPTQEVSTMSDIVIASSEADAAAAAAVEQHHAQMSGTLAALVEALVGSVSRSDLATARTAAQELSTWCEHDLVPHALAEEKAMYPVAQSKAEGRLLVDGMLGEHAVITGLVHELGAAQDMVRAAATGRALQVLFETHLSKENELVLPLGGRAARRHARAARRWARAHRCRGRGRRGGRRRGAQLHLR
jgi:hypothetical protein